MPLPTPQDLAPMRIIVGAIASLIAGALACGGSEPASGTSSEDGEETPVSIDTASATKAKAQAEKLDADYPNHGAVTGVELRVHERPDSGAPVVGWLRIGSQVRLGADRQRGKGCSGRFRAIHPTGFVCDAQLEVRDAPIPLQLPTDDGWKDGQLERAKQAGALIMPAAARDAPLPYDYYFVKEPAVPEYHRLPSRNEQRAALAKSRRYLELLEKGDRRAAAYLGGEADLGPKGTVIAARYLDRGFFVASNGSEKRASRRFVRTTGGRYIKKAQLETRNGHDFKGIELGERIRLPVAWINRGKRLLIATEKADGSFSFSNDDSGDALPRQTLLHDWSGVKNLGGKLMHVLETELGLRYLHSWFVSVARLQKRPQEVPPAGTWVHVDLSEQTLVLYEGDTPVFATLVSTGVEANPTPIGVFEIARKRTTATMADLGPEAGDDRYRIEDVPWVQYFDGSFALHAAFWHTRFGMPRSHGCVNMAPHDAHRIFGSTLPAVPQGWHGMSTVDTALRGSHVVITE